MAVAPSHFAAAATNTVAITINVGDLVCVMICNEDGTVPSGYQDNGGNPMGISRTYGGAAGTPGYALFLIYNAINSATSFSFTDGHNPSIAIATFTGATIARATQFQNTSSTNITYNSTTITNNSYCLLLAAFFSGAAVSVTSYSTGTSGASASASTTNAGATTGYLSTPTPGLYNPVIQANLSATASFIALIVEIEAGTFKDYVGVKPPRMQIGVTGGGGTGTGLYKLAPIFHGGTGVYPNTPVPVAVVLLSGKTGTAYSETITAQGGSGTYTSYAVTSGALPTGTSLNTATGVISGTPTVAGTYSFTIKVTDSLLNTGSQAFQITIVSPSYTLEEYGQVLHDGTLGIAYTETITATNGTAPYTFALASGALPTGLSLNGSTGVISGTPTAVGTFTFAITATDALSVTQTITFSITVTAASGGGVYTFSGG